MLNHISIELNVSLILISFIAYLLIFGIYNFLISYILKITCNMYMNVDANRNTPSLPWNSPVIKIHYRHTRIRLSMLYYIILYGNYEWIVIYYLCNELKSYNSYCYFSFSQFVLFVEELPSQLFFFFYVWKLKEKA